MYLLKELAEKLSVNPRTLRLYAQRKHFPSTMHGQHLVFDEAVYLGLMAHLGQGKTLSSFRVKSPNSVMVSKPKEELTTMTKEENTMTINEEGYDNEELSEYVLELEQKNAELLARVSEMKETLTDYRLELINSAGSGLSNDFVEEHYVTKFRYERDMKKAQKTIERLEQRIAHMSRNPQPVDVLGAVAPPLIQMAEKWLNHKNQTMADKIQAQKQTPNNSQGYRGGFEPRENPGADLEVKIPNWKNVSGSNWNP